MNYENMPPAIQTTQSPAWQIFTYISFFSALGAAAIGIAFMPIEIWMRGYLAVCVLLIVQSALTLAKTQRDLAESTRLVNRVETAKTEKLLMGAGPV